MKLREKLEQICVAVTKEAKSNGAILLILRQDVKALEVFSAIRDSEVDIPKQLRVLAELFEKQGLGRGHAPGEEEVIDLPLRDNIGPKPFTAKTLDTILVGHSCECCNLPYSKANPLSFTSACHPGASVKAEYWGGVITLNCAICNKLIVCLQVAPGRPELTKTQ